MIKRFLNISFSITFLLSFLEFLFIFSFSLDYAIVSCPSEVMNVFNKKKIETRITFINSKIKIEITGFHFYIIKTDSYKIYNLQDAYLSIKKYVLGDNKHFFE